MSQFALLDGRAYAHSSEIMAFVLREFAREDTERVVVDFLKPVTCEVELSLKCRDASAVPNSRAHDVAFIVKVKGGPTEDVYHAVPHAQRPLRERSVSSPSIVQESYAAESLSLVSSARNVSDFLMGVNTCIKRHASQFRPRDGAQAMRRTDFRAPFQVPTGMVVNGQRTQLKLGAQAWRFTSALMPSFELSLIGLPFTPQQPPK